MIRTTVVIITMILVILLLLVTGFEMGKTMWKFENAYYGVYPELIITMENGDDQLVYSAVRDLKDLYPRGVLESLLMEAANETGIYGPEDKVKIFRIVETGYLLTPEELIEYWKTHSCFPWEYE